ncbi:hypothetical protein ACEQ8H_004060 [Pleosporales sp. CAS-2024a]
MAVSSVAHANYRSTQKKLAQATKLFARVHIGKHAISQPSVTLAVAIAFTQRFSRPVAYAITKPNWLSACKIPTPLNHTALWVSVANTSFTVSISQTQWSTQLQPRQQVTVAREELYAQPDSQRRLARAQECKEALTRNVKEGHIREIFGKYGVIKDLRMPMNPLFNVNRGTAYILYEEIHDAERAIAKMHDAQLDGAKLQVSIVLPRRRFSVTPPPARRGPPPRDRFYDDYDGRAQVIFAVKEPFAAQKSIQIIIQSFGVTDAATKTRTR